jgi:hypothetical protein
MCAYLAERILRQLTAPMQAQNAPPANACLLPAMAALGMNRGDPALSRRLHQREKVFGPGWAVPLDRNQKARIMAYARAWTARECRPGQHRGPITRAFLDVLQALLWGFHNSRSGACFPSYAAIAAKAGCHRGTVAEALKVLEWAGVLTWQHRIARVRERCRDLWGRAGWRWRVVRTSNAYVFRDPVGHAVENRDFRSKSENPAGTPNQVIKPVLPAPAAASDSPLERVLARLGAAIGARLLTNGSGAAARAFSV